MSKEKRRLVVDNGESYWIVGGRRLSKKEAIDLEINDILNPLLSNDLENLLLQNVERPKSPPPRRINKRGATMGMKLGF